MICESIKIKCITHNVIKINENTEMKCQVNEM